MVIAPLLGPNIALALAAALGDTGLMLKSLKTSLVGLVLALGLSFLIGALWPLNVHSRELLARTEVGLDSIVLALASGAAAVFIHGFAQRAGRRDGGGGLTAADRDHGAHAGRW